MHWWHVVTIVWITVTTAGGLYSDSQRDTKQMLIGFTVEGIKVAAIAFVLAAGGFWS